ncbi:deoxyribonuclease-2-alpha precursor [Xenopus tropicalis]|uniref:Deoxyribonuclease-2-alpha n=1 Tax=Xenopus tropicalis TaxID=8364 RepID=Q28DA6_XENTR|nr:deoxyribonuclease-2-alpha precursor [Xenopus tropicalis]CAJ81448.1 deoxyribonuclease II, lysosomal [Xenopus tropicalis]|eukprot:NP_001039073.1 deoxyribonuclease-2-alpha precursor [Xenopus tropicalis]
MLLRLLMHLILPLGSFAATSCYGDHGKQVDWFIVYKLPQLRNKGEEAGMTYMYQDSSSGGWVPGATLMNSTDSAVGQTVSQLYKAFGMKDVAYILYNDEPANISSSGSDRGHTKGMLLLDKKQGFWLVHSTPRFPPPADQSYDWPLSAHRNGQSFLCVTYPYKQFGDIGQQLLYNTILPYDSSIPEDFSVDFPELKTAAEKGAVTQPPWNRQVVLTSVGGKQFTSFSKHAHFSDDLYSGWVSQVLKSHLFVQFWQNSRGVLPSNCSLPFHTYNIMEIDISCAYSFSTHNDHSKWCVTDGAGWACVGDMNRDVKEERRGGGTVCVNDPNVWKSFRSLVSSYNNCTGPVSYSRV